MTLEQRFWEKVSFAEHPKGCHEWQGALLVNFGYGAFNENGKTVRAHRFAWKLAHGEESDFCILHSCDNPKCVRVSHLFEGGVLENNQDMVRKERHGRMLFSHEQVRRLRALKAKYGRALSNQRIADWFGVCKATISHMMTGRNWKFA